MRLCDLPRRVVRFLDGKPEPKRERRYSDEHMEYRRNYMREYYADGRGKESAKRSRERNRAMIRVRQQRWYLNNIEHCAKKDRERWESIKADPVAHAAFKAKRNARRRMKTLQARAA